MKGSNKMKKCRNCVALIMAMIMMLTAFSVMPMTSSAESTNVRTNYPVVTDANGKSTRHLNNASDATSHIWNKSSKPNYITVTLKKPNYKTVIINYVVKLWKQGKTYKWQYGSFNNKGEFTNSYVNEKNNTVTTSENSGKFCIQYIFQKNCDVSNTITKIGKTKSRAKIPFAQRKNLTVKLSKGDFYVDGFYRLYSKTKVEGSGEKTRLIKTRALPIFINFDNDDTNTKGYNGSQNITVRNFVVAGGDDKAKTYKPSSFMYFLHGANLKVENITVEKALYYSHVFQLTSSRNIEISNCNFKNILYTDSVNTDNKRNDVIYRVATDKPLATKNFDKYLERQSGKKGTGKFYHFEVAQIETDEKGAMPTIKSSWDGTSTKNVNIHNCNFNGVVRAIGSHAAGKKNCNGITIQNNKFTNVVGHAISLPFEENVTISKNKFKNVSDTKIKGSAIYYVKGKKISIVNSGKNKNTYSKCASKVKAVSKY